MEAQRRNTALLAAHNAGSHAGPEAAISPAWCVICAGRDPSLTGTAEIRLIVRRSLSDSHDEPLGHISADKV